MSKLSEKNDELLKRVKILEESSYISNDIKQKIIKLKLDIPNASDETINLIDKSLKIYEELLQKLNKIYEKENLLKKLYKAILNIKLGKRKLTEKEVKKEAKLKKLIIDSITTKINQEFNGDSTSEGNPVPLIDKFRTIITERILTELNTDSETFVQKIFSFKKIIKRIALKKLSKQKSKIYKENVRDVVDKILILIRNRVEQLKELLPEILDIIKFMSSGNYNLEQTINKTIQLIIIFSVLNVLDIVMKKVALTNKQVINLVDSVYNILYTKFSNEGHIVKHKLKTKDDAKPDRVINIKFQSIPDPGTGTSETGTDKPEIIIILSLDNKKPISNIFSQRQLFNILNVLFAEFKDINNLESTNILVGGEKSNKEPESIPVGKKSIDSFIDDFAHKNYDNEDKNFIKLIDMCILRDPPVLIKSDIKIKIQSQFLTDLMDKLSNDNKNEQLVDENLSTIENVIKLFTEHLVNNDYLINSLLRSSKSSESSELSKSELSDSSEKKLVNDIKNIVLKKLNTHLKSDSTEEYIDIFSIDSDKFPDELKWILTSLINSLHKLNAPNNH